MNNEKSYAHLAVVPVPFQILVEDGLTPNQWCLLYLLHNKLDREQLAYLTAENAPQGWNPDELNDLHDRFYLIFEPVAGNHPKLSPINFRVSERYTDLLDKLKVKVPKVQVPLEKPMLTKPVLPGMGLDALEFFDELFLLYPSHIDVNGTLMSGRSGDYEQLADAYARYLVSRKAVPHPDIMEITTWAKENNHLRMGLAKYISSREWIGLAELRDKGQGGTYTNQDAI